MTTVAQRIADNLSHVRDRIARSAARSGRSAESIQLVAVTKYADIRVTHELRAAGCLDLGESRPQVLWEKAAALGAETRWHLVGHLQRNKVDRTIALTTLIHSADSIRLLNAVQRAAERQLRRVAVLLEVNVSGEAEKHGWQPAEMKSVVATLSDYPQIEVRGLMTMASRSGGQEQARREFARLRSLRDALRQEECPSPVALEELSMGMSGDFEVAIEEGATIVRVGSALLEGCLD